MSFFIQTRNLEKFARSKKWTFFFNLIKPRLVPMVLIATASGFYLGTPAKIDLLTLFHVLLGTALASSGTLALNQVIEKDIDKKMKRTKDRPLPSGHIFISEAIVFSSLLLISGLIYLLIFGNIICSFITLSSSAIYLLIYTPLKTRSPLNSIIGAIPGAIPPLIGWSAATGFLSFESFILFTILFLWQIPHALAIAIMYKEEFVAAGIKLLPANDPIGRNTCRHIIVYCLTLIPVGMMPKFIGMAGNFYFFSSIFLGIIYLSFAISLFRNYSIPYARKLFYVSLIYLPLLLLSMILNQVN
tara:strand:- start:1139 stop:2041 length:903 start_codon:yes stop_codon:yes gene_type:complete